MLSRRTKKQTLREYLIENPIDRSKSYPYNDTANKFSVSIEKVRNTYKYLRQKGLIKNESVNSPIGDKERIFKEDVIHGAADVTVITKKRIKTLKDLLEICEVDEKEWQVISYEVNKWEVGRKEKQVSWTTTNSVATGTVKDTGKIHVEPLFQVKAKLSRRKIDKDLGLQKEAILKELKGYSPVVKIPLNERLNFDSRKHLLEICIFDPHFGKLSWREETGEDYDLKIAEKRVKAAIAELLEDVGVYNLGRIEKILLPLGNDLINVDNKNNTTANGTPQDTDVRFIKTIRTVRRVLVELINDLSTIAPIDVVIVPGNHDTTSSFMMGEILEAFFHNNERVNVENSPKLRKYYKYGQNSIQFTHGNEEKHESLGNIFATAEPKLWAETKFRFCQLGHFHKNKKIEYVSVDQHQGFIIQTLPSLSGKDAWHFKKGYDALKQAKAFLFDVDKGLKGEFTVTIAE